MKNRWYLTGSVYVIGILFSLYAVMFAKYDTMQMWIAYALMAACFIFYFIRRNNYIRRQRGNKK